MVLQLWFVLARFMQRLLKIRITLIKIDMSNKLIDRCWDALLQLSKAIKEHDDPLEFCSIRFGINPAVAVNKVLNANSGDYLIVLSFSASEPIIDKIQLQKGGFFQLRDNMQVDEIWSIDLSNDIKQFITIYSPYCFAPYYAKQKSRAFSVSHFAQSLDGCIATSTGDSKWIGSQENLVHAHRMRAICDSVLIGSGTLRIDKPKLTVRHVKGPPPLRIVIGKSVKDIDSLRNAARSPILLIGAKNKIIDDVVETVNIDGESQFIDGLSVLKFLYKKNIFSVYIEGGSITTSHFLMDDAIDIIQLHISPIILGKGLKTFDFPLIEKVSESIRFKSNQYFRIGDGFMFVGKTRTSI